MHSPRFAFSLALLGSVQVAVACGGIKATEMGATEAADASQDGPVHLTWTTKEVCGAG
jgi:hypothetical protein